MTRSDLEILIRRLVNNSPMLVVVDTFGIKILVLNVIEWAKDDSIDGGLALKIEEKGRRMLRIILIEYDIYKCERIVKLCGPDSKIVGVGERIHSEMIILGARGLGSTASSLGSISANVVELTRILVQLINYLDYSNK